MKTLFFKKKKVHVLQAILNVLNRIYIYRKFDLEN